MANYAVSVEGFRYPRFEFPLRCRPHRGSRLTKRQQGAFQVRTKAVDQRRE
jgi:hypothetical protein